jgi:hypothetical protein
MAFENCDYMERVVFQRRDVQASDETATGYDDTNHEPRAGKKRLYVFRRRVKDIAKELSLVFLLTVKRRSMARRRVFDSFLFHAHLQAPTLLWVMERTYFFASSKLLFLCAIGGTALHIHFFSLFTFLTFNESLISSNVLSAGGLVFSPASSFSRTMIR